MKLEELKSPLDMGRMSEVEIRQWVRMLGKNAQERVRVLQDLLAHAKTDQMSLEDRAIITRVLHELRVH